MMNWDTKNKLAKELVVNVSDQSSLLTDLGERFERGEGFSVATINLDHTVKLRQDFDFAKAYRTHTHVTADGNPIVWLSHLAGQKDVRLVPGSELIEPLCKVAAAKGMPVALLGATAVSLEAAAESLRERTPDIEIVLCLAPAMGFDPKGEAAINAIESLRASGARLVFLALGAPKQECFASFASTMLPQTGFVSIGAGLDFISGAQVRAPKWVRSLSLEWMWRMFGNPRRLVSRYAACFLILPRLMLRSFATRLATLSR